MAANTTLIDYFPKQRKPPTSAKVKIGDYMTKSSIISSDKKPTIDPDLEELNAFDLDYSYGPAIGMTRLERWERAKKLGLNPDPKIKKIIEQHSDDSKYTKCVWSGTLVDLTT